MKVVLFILILFNLYDLEGQTNFRPGYIITNENDTLNGFIDNRGDTRNSKKCDFKQNLNSDSKEFLPLSIKGYRFVDGKCYISKKINFNGEDIQLFLEFLVKGISDLYYYADGANFHYFIALTDGNLRELKNEQKTVFVNNIPYSHETKEFIGQLRYAFADCPQIYPLINRAVLNDKSLIKITKTYHDYVCNDGKCIIYEKQLPSVKISLAPFVSINGSFLKIKYSSIYESVQFKMANYPTIGLLLKASLPRFNEKLSFQASAEIGKTYFYGTGINPDNSAFEEVHLHAQILKVKAGLKYTYPKGRIRPTFMIGANALKSVKSDGRKIDEVLRGSTIFTSEVSDVPIPDILVGYHLNIGIDYQLSASLIAFCNLGYDSSSGTKTNYFSQFYSTIINTFNIHAGIYF